MSIDVDGDVSLHQKMKRLPLKFVQVSGRFDCMQHELKTLDGCPTYVGWHFNCSENDLTTLEHCPSYIGGNFNCVNNEITTLQHLPMNFYIGGNFYCSFNFIESATEYSRLFFGTVVGEISTGANKIDKFLNEHKNPPKKDLPRLLSELRKIQL